MQSALATRNNEYVQESIYSFFIKKEDQSLPCLVRIPVSHSGIEVENRAKMAQRWSLGKRVQLRIDIEALTAGNRRNPYRRLRAKHVTISIGSPEEAEAVVQAIHGFLRSLDGKRLVAASQPETPPPGTK